MGAIETPYRNDQINIPGDKVIFNPFSCNCLMDEDWKNYDEMFNWLTSFKDEDDWRNLIKDIKVYILSSNKKILKIFTLVGAIPTNIRRY